MSSDISHTSCCWGNHLKIHIFFMCNILCLLSKYLVLTTFNYKNIHTYMDCLGSFWCHGVHEWAFFQGKSKFYNVKYIKIHLTTSTLLSPFIRGDNVPEITEDDKGQNRNDERKAKPHDLHCACTWNYVSENLKFKLKIRLKMSFFCMWN